LVETNPESGIGEKKDFNSLKKLEVTATRLHPNDTTDPDIYQTLL
jgi:hypothetical protein